MKGMPEDTYWALNEDYDTSDPSSEVWEEVQVEFTGEDGKRQAVRLTASSMGGQCAGSRGRTG